MESLKRARKRAGLSLAELAERCGLHSVSIARAERTVVELIAGGLSVDRAGATA